MSCGPSAVQMCKPVETPAAAAMPNSRSGLLVARNSKLAWIAQACGSGQQSDSTVCTANRRVPPDCAPIAARVINQKSGLDPAVRAISRDDCTADKPGHMRSTAFLGPTTQKGLSLGALVTAASVHVLHLWLDWSGWRPAIPQGAPALFSLNAPGCAWLARSRIPSIFPVRGETRRGPQSAATIRRPPPRAKTSARAGS